MGYIMDAMPFPRRLRGEAALASLPSSQPNLVEALSIVSTTPQLESASPLWALSPGRMAFLRRNSRGSMPRRAATASVWDSQPKQA